MRYNYNMENDIDKSCSITMVNDRLSNFEISVKQDFKETNKKIDSVNDKIANIVLIGVVFIVLSILSNPLLGKLILHIKPAFAN